jgi:predicted transcriptional regulator
MYASNLSWNNLSEILKTLTSKGFIRKEVTAKAKRYYITEKGIEALRYHQKSLEGLVPAYA